MALGGSGWFCWGILLLWNPDRVTIHITGGSTQSVHGLVEVRNPISSFLLSSIYASTNALKRQSLWDELVIVANTLNVPWVAVGDFNDILCQSEKFGGRPLSRKRVETYAETMNECNLIDIGVHVPKLTWSSKRKNNPIFQRLERGGGTRIGFLPSQTLHCGTLLGSRPTTVRFFYT